jgi:membrane protein
MVLPGRDVPVKDFWRALWTKIERGDLLDYAGSVAFSALLSVFPFLIFAVSLASLVIDPERLGALVEDVRRAMPAQAADVVIARLHALASGPSGGIATLGAMVTIWSASGTVTALIAAFDRAWEVRESRPFWKTRGLAVLVTLAGAVFFVAAAALALVTPAVAGALGHPLGDIVVWLRWPAAAILMLLILACLYHVLPDVDRDFRLVTPGSVTAVVAWILASLGFSLYTSHFGRYELVYGALGGAIVLILWMWLSALAILLGAEVDALADHLAERSEGTGGAPPPHARRPDSGRRARRCWGRSTAGSRAALRPPPFPRRATLRDRRAPARPSPRTGRAS